MSWRQGVILSYDATLGLHEKMATRQLSSFRRDSWLDRWNF